MVLLLSATSIFLSILAAFLSTTDGLAIKLVPRHKIDPVLFPKHLTELERNQMYANLSLSRALLRAGSPVKAARLRPKLKQLQSSVFVVSVAIGSQPYETFLEVDTGSDVTWVQCVDCRGCFKIRGGAFDPALSGTYQKLANNDDLCRKQRSLEKDCKFNEAYGGDQEVSGITSKDTVRFKTKSGTDETIKDLIFGCATSAKKISFRDNDGENNPIAGILGMGATGGYRDSFMEVTKQRTKRQFSYCLPRWNEGQHETEVLFGDDVQPLPPAAQTIHLLNDLYNDKVQCTDISVGGRQLKLSSANFKEGFEFDTGSETSYLGRQAYNAVRDEFVNSLKRYVKPLENPSKLCFQWPLPKEIRQLPSLKFHFGEANIEIEFANIFQENPEHNQVCMAIDEGKMYDVSILGAISMANYRFVHNLSHRTLSFYPEDCRRN